MALPMTLLVLLMFVASSSVNAHVPASEGPFKHVRPVSYQRPLYSHGSALDPCRYYFDVDTAAHQKNLEECVTHGVNWPISLSVYGSPKDPRYAVVLSTRHRNGYAWISALNKTAYLRTLEVWKTKKNLPILISVLGPPGNEIYAAVAENQPTLTPAEWRAPVCGLSEKGFGDAMKRPDTTLLSFTVYGTPAQRQYCGIWQKTSAVQRSSFYLAQNANDYARIQALESDKTWRPANLIPHGDGKVSATFTDTTLGLRPVSALVDIPSKDLAQRHDEFSKQNLTLVQLQGATPTNANAAVFAAVWAEAEVPPDRVFNVGGKDPSGKNAAAATKLDEAVRSVLQVYRVR